MSILAYRFYIVLDYPAFHSRNLENLFNGFGAKIVDGQLASQLCLGQSFE
jgi:hypothetical protein